MHNMIYVWVFILNNNKQALAAHTHTQTQQTRRQTSVDILDSCLHLKLYEYFSCSLNG